MEIDDGRRNEKERFGGERRESGTDTEENKDGPSERQFRGISFNYLEHRNITYNYNVIQKSGTSLPKGEELVIQETSLHDRTSNESIIKRLKKESKMC